MDSIIEKFLHQVNDHPNKLLYSFLDRNGNPTESYTYLNFFNRSSAIAVHIQRNHKFRFGDRVLLAYPPGLEMICAFFACVRLGLIPVPVYPTSSQGFQAALYKITFIAKDCNAVAILTTRPYYWSMKVNLARTKIAKFSFKTDFVSKLLWIITDDVSVNEEKNFIEAHSEILFLQYTSGSTNDPKGVMVTHKNVIHNANLVVDHTPIGVSWLPQYHDMGLIGYYLFFALKNGTTYGFSPVDFIQRPALWLETITKYKATASSAPNFAYAYCLMPDKISAEEISTLNLSSLRFLMTAAEPVRTNTYQKFLQKFESYGLKPESFFSAYGLAEFTLAVSNYGRTIRSFDTQALSESKVKLIDRCSSTIKSTELISCGKTLGDTEVKIVDVSLEPKEAEPGRVGEIWIQGNSKCLGYWNRDELTKQIFEATGARALHGKSWLRSGDLGFMHDGELYICGRIKDLIIVRGLNYYPQDVERIIETDSAIRKGCVAAFAVEKDGQETLAVVAEIKNPKAIPDVKQLNQKLLQHLGLVADIIICIAPRTISKTSSGKIIRHQAKKLFLEKKLSPLYSWQTQKIDSSTYQNDALQKLFNQYNLSHDVYETFANAGFDSLRLAEFAHDLKIYLQAQGYKDLAQPIDLGLIQKIAVSELYEILDALRSSSIESKLRFKQIFSNLQNEHKKVIDQRMKDDVAQADFSKIFQRKVNNKTSINSILLTGGTGFFGPFLLESLLRQSQENIYVLVRANNEGDGLTRLQQAFETIKPSPAVRLAFDERVKPVCGNLAHSRLGLTLEKWNFFTNNIHTIYHNGALVNYLFDYEAMRSINVEGTNEIIKLVGEGQPKELNHISTTFIFGWSVKDTLFESDTNQNMDLLDFGYSQSKWVSEQLVLKAMKAGLRARIFRPALISPSVSGDGYNFDIAIRLLAFMIKHGITTDTLNQVSFIPADIAANNIVAISNLEESIAQTFHITRDEYATLQDVTNIFNELLGKSFQSFNLRDFVPEVVSRCEKEDILFPLLNFLVRSIDNIKAMEFKRYDNTQYKRFRNLSAHSLADPSLKDVVLGIYRFMENQRIVETLMPRMISKKNERTKDIA